MTEETMEKIIAERVQAGVDMLDEHKSGWAKDINLTDLEMSTSEYCILGQLYGRFSEGLAILMEREDVGDRDPTDVAPDWGFDTGEEDGDLYEAAPDDIDSGGGHVDYYRLLQTEWEHVVHERQNG